MVHAGRLLDHPGKAPRGPSTIVIRDGRISDVLDGFIDVPGSQRVVDQRSRFVLPGLIDSHVHLVSDTGGQMGQLEDVQAEDAELAYNALANAHKTLRSAIAGTFVRCCTRTTTFATAWSPAAAPCGSRWAAAWT